MSGSQNSILIFFSIFQIRKVMSADVVEPLHHCRLPARGMDCRGTHGVLALAATRVNIGSNRRTIEVFSFPAAEVIFRTPQTTHRSLSADPIIPTHALYLYGTRSDTCALCLYVQRNQQFLSFVPYRFNRKASLTVRTEAESSTCLRLNSLLLASFRI